MTILSIECENISHLYFAFSNKKYIPKEIKWKNVKKYEGEYIWSTAQVTNYKENLYIKLSGYHINSIFFMLENYKRYTIREICSVYEDLGIHTYDALLNFLHNNGVKMGYIIPILKPMKEYI